MSPHPIYRGLVRLYPSEFRRDYGDDLVQHFDDLVADRGSWAASRRTALDMALTVPRYRLETIVKERHATTIAVTTGLLAGAGVASTLIGIYPGGLLLVLAVALAIAQRSSLATALRAPDIHRRRRRLLTAAMLGLGVVGCYLTFLVVIGDSWTTRETVIAVVGNAALVGSLGFLAAGLLTPKTPTVA